MARYLLSVRIYNTLVGRGYKLVCRRQQCNLPLDKMTPEKQMENETVEEYEARKLESTVESKPSKYHHWECDKCGERLGYKPKSVRVRNTWVYLHEENGCGGRIYNIGRKFYHASCYDETHYGTFMRTITHSLRSVFISKMKGLRLWK